MITQNIQKFIMMLQLDHSSWLFFQLQKILIFIPTIILQLIIVVLLLKVCFLMMQSVNGFVQKKKISLFVFFGFVFIFLLHQQHKIFQKKLALVVKDSAFVYAGPELTFHTLFQLNSGTYVLLLERNEKMGQVKIHEKQGWIAIDNLEIQ